MRIRRHLELKLANTKLADLKVGAGLTIGVVRGLSYSVTNIALASLIFGGILSAYFVEGIGLILVGSAAMAIVGAFRSEIPGALVGTPMAVWLVLVVTSQALPLDGRPLFVTFVVFILLSALLCGVLLYVLGRFRVAGLLRFVPYEVAAGSLSGIGILVVLLGLRMCGLDLRSPQLASFTNFEIYLNWGSALLYAFLLVWVSKMWRSFLVMPLSFLFVCVLAHLILAVFNVPLDSAREAGFFLEIHIPTTVWPPLSIQDIGLIDWQVLMLQIPSFLALVTVLLLVTVVGVSGLELSSNSDLNWNQEFRSSGISSFISGVVSGPPGAIIVTSTIQHQKLHAATPVTCLTLAIVMLVLVFFGMEVVRFIPVPALGAILLQLGWYLIADWLIANRKRLPNIDYGIVCAVCVCIVLFGYLRGIAIGIAITIVLFLVRLSNVPVIDRSQSLEEVQSRKTRNIPEQAILRKLGKSAWLYGLSGYVFFGSAQSLFLQIKKKIEEDGDITCVVFDLSATTGFDLSAIDAFAKFVEYATSNQTQVVIAATTKRVRDELNRSMDAADQDPVYWEIDEDHAIERAEELLIESYTSNIEENPTLKQDLFDEVASGVESRLQRQSTFEDLVSRPEKWGEMREYQTGEVICSISQLPPGLQFVISGDASVVDESGTRLYECGYGDAIEARSGFQAYSASTTTQATSVCRTLLLTRESLNEISEQDSELSLKIYRFLMQNNALMPTH